MHVAMDGRIGDRESTKLLMTKHPQETVLTGQRLQFDSGKDRDGAAA